MEYTTFDGQWAGAEQRFVYKPVDLLRLTAGGEVQEHFDVHQFDGTDVGGVQVDDTRSFSLVAAYLVGDVLPARWLKVEAAGRLDAYSTFGSSISPRLAVIARPTEDDNVKVLAGKAFRAPSDYELFYVAPGGQLRNPNLQPENMYSAEVEYSHVFSTTVTGLVSMYENLITDLIALRNVGPLQPDGTQPYEYENTNAPVATVGFEAELRREWKEGWMVAGSYSYQRSKYVASSSLGDVFAQTPNTGLREVPNAPEHLASIKGAVPILSRALEAATRLTFTGPRWDRYDQPTDPAQGRTTSAVLWDFVFSGTEQRWRLSYAVGVYNAFDWRWAVPVSPELRQTTIAQSGRTFLATAGVTF
jgi:outer membrane receptor protein involved in Fe transport